MGHQGEYAVLPYGDYTGDETMPRGVRVHSRDIRRNPNPCYRWAKQPTVPEYISPLNPYGTTYVQSLICALGPYPDSDNTPKPTHVITLQCHYCGTEFVHEIVHRGNIPSYCTEGCRQNAKRIQGRKRMRRFSERKRHEQHTALQH